ncbi:MAG: hypothetical protein OXE50_00115, partial [Chloroflexi bacterium]|nr:hypothetical protein [Chloroflexota bacterium]
MNPHGLGRQARQAALALLLIALAAASLAACGGDSPSEGPTQSTQAPGMTPGNTPASADTPTPVSVADSGSASGDREALIAFYNATDGPNWDNNTNWLSDAPLAEWSGVETDANGRVITLDLRWNRLTGEIPSELGSLSNLESLGLGLNQLTGEIPPWLGDLSNLEQLFLNSNDLSGEIPPELG